MFGGFLSGWKYLEDYFYSSEKWTDTQVEVFDTLYNVNLMGFAPWKGVADYFYGKRSANEYRDRYGISGGGHDPRKLAREQGSIVNAFGSSMNFVSRNLDSLYQDKKKSRRARR